MKFINTISSTYENTLTWLHVGAFIRLIQRAVAIYFFERQLEDNLQYILNAFLFRFLLQFHQYSWASTFIARMKITVSTIYKLMDNLPIKTICYQKLHFNEQLISWIAINSTIKFRKIGIKQILMKPQYCPFMKCFPFNQEWKSVLLL